MVTRHLILALLSLCALEVSAAEKPAQRIIGIYSDLDYNDEGGDLLGMELIIIPSGGSDLATYSIFVQIAEGGAPYVALVTAHVKGKRIEFTLPPGEPYGKEHFVGEFKGIELTVHWSGGTVEHLKRGKSYWQ
jgi:hypothetical protein